MNALLLAKTRRSIDQFRDLLLEADNSSDDFSMQKQASLSALLAACQASLKNTQESINLEMSIEMRQSLLTQLSELKSQFYTLSTKFASKKETSKNQRPIYSTPESYSHSSLEIPTYEKPATVNTRLGYVGSLLDEHLEAGAQTLDALKQQRSILKSARTRALTMANSLGVSQALIRWIDLRSKQDKALFYFGMIFSLFLLIFLYIYFL